MSHTYGIISALYSPHIGGVELFTSNIARELSRQGNAVFVITSRLSGSDPEIEEQPDGVRIIRLPSYVLLGGRLPIIKRNARFKQMMSYLEDCGIDRVLVNTRFYPLSIAGLEFARAVGAKAVMLDHGSDYLTLGNTVIDIAIRGYEHSVTARAKTFHPVFAGISKKSCEWLRTFGIDTDVVIPNAIDVERFRGCASSRDFRNEYGIPPQNKLISFVGRLSPEKGAEQLADASALLGEGYSMLFAGEGTLRRVIEEKHLPNVALLGSISSEDVSALLSQSDAFCLPSRSEGFCTALLEANAWDIPCVVPDIGGVAEVFGTPPQGVAILRSTTAEEIAEQLRRTLHSPVVSFTKADYSWDSTVRALESAFCEAG